MEDKKKTLVINLFGGPGSGKSTTCAQVFAKLKLMGYNCEMALEYAKDKVWERSFFTLNNQIMVFGKQHHRIFRLLDEVEIIITDSPLLLSIIYDKNESDTFRSLVIEEFNKLNSLNFFIKRDDYYNPKGRTQNLNEAKELDSKIKDLLLEAKIPYEAIEKGNDDYIVNYIVEYLNRDLI